MKSSSGMGSLASFHSARSSRGGQVELQFSMGMVGFSSQQRKDPKQLQDAIHEQMNQLKKLTEAEDMEMENEEAPKDEKPKPESKEFETPGSQTPQIQSNCSTAAFDANQLSLLQSYMKQNGGAGLMPF